jgi:hypothetical protein
MNKYQISIMMTKWILDTDDLELCHRYWDRLFHYIFINFPKPEMLIVSTYDKLWKEGIPEELEHTVNMFNKSIDELYTGLIKVPPDFIDVIFPIAIARYILLKVTQRGGINPDNLCTFDEFCARYTGLVCSEYQARYVKQNREANALYRKAA